MSLRLSWNQDHLAPVDQLLFRSDLVKVGCFHCEPAHPSFARTEALDNDLFVFPRHPILTRTGMGEFQFQEPGGIALLRANAEVERRPVDGQGAWTYWFGIHPRVFEQTLIRYRLSDRALDLSITAYPRLHLKIECLLRDLDRGWTDALAIQDAVLALFDRIGRHLEDQCPPRSKGRAATGRRHRRVAEDARRFIDAHLGEAMSLSEIARAIGASPYHLCRVFHEQTGLTPHAYRMRQRLGRAISRLMNGQVESLTDLALDLGFSSHSHLSRAFRQEVGLPPSALSQPGSGPITH